MDKLTEILGTWEGYRLGTVQRFASGELGESAQVWLELQPAPERTKVCNGCGESVETEHDRSERWVRDLPILDARTHLCGPEKGDITD